LLDSGEVEQKESQFTRGGDVALALLRVGVGMGEEVQLFGEAIGGDGAQDVVAEEAEIAEVGVDGGAGAAELSGDMHGGAALAPEVMGFEDASAASRAWRVGRPDGVGLSLRRARMF